MILTLTVGPMSHGGHCVARHEGRVVFVRHAVPGETVRAVVTDGGEKARFWRADTIDVLEPSDHRRRHPWKQADALRAYNHGQVPVGGADYGHITDVHQRRLKAHVFRDTLQRIGGIDISALDLPELGPEGELTTRQLPGADASGMHWRTRVSFGVVEGSLGMKPHRSHDLIPLRAMPLAVEAVGASGIFTWDFSGAASVDVVAPGGEGPLSLIITTEDPSRLPKGLQKLAEETPEVASILLRSPEGQDYQVLTGEREITEELPVPVVGDSGDIQESVQLAPEGFWQIHRRAPEQLVSTVDRMAKLGTGGTAIDLYAGAGLFTAWAAHRVGHSGQVLSVEAAEGSSAAAERLFAARAGVEVVCAAAEKIARRLERSDLVVLDPPRTGAYRKVLEGIDQAGPGQIIYVSCDPASFARDAKGLLQLGWQLRGLEVLDMYPNTHHMESVALFERR
ncbi:class I SAM-dependent RNA methyltransferase [Nesterenkonia sp. MY13]|uniref:Class I SAM-dependent RNA methyltransferase n=1 Tax=Nesterenkonia sedimenti TaxID=1463632 RepID=A0A7X8THF4_9MICC|nr:class I SAM-dependent RNA methyltransferase [Nesterenkonia sedimenti]NLS08781.1 class I SAM-dependent RNA methyltransferase [Nesterenkonia sedimenti]